MAKKEMNLLSDAENGFKASVDMLNTVAPDLIEDLKAKPKAEHATAIESWKSTNPDKVAIWEKAVTAVKDCADKYAKQSIPAASRQTATPDGESKAIEIKDTLASNFKTPNDWLSSAVGIDFLEIARKAAIAIQGIIIELQARLAKMKAGGQANKEGDNKEDDTATSAMSM